MTPSRPAQLLIGLLILLATPGIAAARDVVPTEAAKQATLSDLSWLCGSWEGIHFGDDSDYYLSPAQGDSMVGLYRIVGKDGKLEVAECDLFQQTGKGIEYHFEIYGPGLVLNPNTPFGSDRVYLLQDLGPNYVVFGNPGDGPMREQRITLDGDTISTEVTFEGKDGKPFSVVLKMDRAGTQPAGSKSPSPQ